MKLPLSQERLFPYKIYQRGDCWEWRGTIKPNGYGCAGVGNNKKRRAHRVAYEMAKGPLYGYSIDHRCSHKWCVRPSHLEAVTIQENNRRSLATPSTINAMKTHCKRGHQFDEKNTRYTPRGKRVCRICANWGKRGLLEASSR